MFPVVVLWNELFTLSVEPVPDVLWQGAHLSCFPDVHSVIDGIARAFECVLLLLWHPLFSHVMVAFVILAVLLFVCSNIAFDVKPFWWQV